MKLQSQVVSGSEEFRANVKGHMEALDIVRDAAEAATAGGGAKARERHLARSKMLP